MFDKLMTFIDGALTLAAGTYYSDTIPLGKLGVNLDETDLYVQVTAAVTSAGAATVQFVLEKDTTSAFGSPTTVLDTGALVKATLVDNYVIMNRKLSKLAYQEATGSDTYLRIKYVVAVADLTAGSIKGGITLGQPVNNKG